MINNIDSKGKTLSFNDLHLNAKKEKRRRVIDGLKKEEESFAKQYEELIFGKELETDLDTTTNDSNKFKNITFEDEEDESPIVKKKEDDLDSELKKNIKLTKEDEESIEKLKILRSKEILTNEEYETKIELLYKKYIKIEKDKIKEEIRKEEIKKEKEEKYKLSRNSHRMNDNNEIKTKNTNNNIEDEKYKPKIIEEDSKNSKEKEEEEKKKLNKKESDGKNNKKEVEEEKKEDKNKNEEDLKNNNEKKDKIQDKVNEDLIYKIRIGIKATVMNLLILLVKKCFKRDK
jgi:hypothetical protein